MDPTKQQRRAPAETMHETAAALERSEAVLHDSAEASLDEDTKQRLHALGDAVTRQAGDIERRARLIDEQTTSSVPYTVAAAD